MFKIDIYLNRSAVSLVVLTLCALFFTGSFLISTGTGDAGRRAAPVRQAALTKYYPYRIALTFDDGPHPYFTDRLISILGAHDVKASFFVVGSQAMRYPDLLQHLRLAGHEVESHTFTHRNLSRLNDADIKKELATTARLIEEVGGSPSIFFRPPGGQYNPRVVKAAQEMGGHMVLWTVFPKDHEVDDPAVIVQRVLAQAADGGVVLLHSGREATIVALPRIINALRERGYRFVTVSQLYEEKNPGKLADLKVVKAAKE